MPRSLNKWVMVLAVTAVAIAVVFRVPQIKKIVVGE